jgi:hypothetical protein
VRRNFCAVQYKFGRTTLKLERLLLLLFVLYGTNSIARHKICVSSNYPLNGSFCEATIEVQLKKGTSIVIAVIFK